MANRLLADRDASPTRFNRKYDYQRAKCEDLTLIREWFALVKNIIAKYGINLANIYNFDETGFMMGLIASGMVVTGAERRGRPKSVQPGNREWVTVIQAINAEGWAIQPFIVVAGQYHLASWYQESNLPGDWAIATTKTGWTDNETGLEWLKHFDRHTKARSTGGYRLLILDGHESHHSTDFETYCEENNIITLYYSVIFVKPLPGYLLSYEFWERHLSSDKALHSAACGLLLSYTWLVAYRTDFDIAKEYSLLPESLTWNAWTSFVTSFLDHLEVSETQLISQRYLYGELRMSRINYIYKLIPSLWFRDNPMRGFMPTSMWNKSFLERNIARLLGIFVFFSLILSAMQVGLATSQLQENVSFVNASYGFVVTSLFIVLLSAVISLVILVWHVRYKIILPWTLSLQEIRGHDL
ncbi:hypothetical protein NCS57_01475100 [Fusarium keratoplasticum]|uniref:Uncharacterized protein n=1 Tax=Fusarium keratoplasticum TaxID=1328300 RepID=A0ACC0QAM3_9HYPO|nr:hypothetical protein NCS57_01475100 [Fusarium keratoplasticum]KAI8648635.1 hypothetical protein NCS57_01475100 [Fusarium keratoplasticum]